VGFNSPMPGWLNGPPSGWTTSPLDQNIPAFSELVDEPAPRKTVGRLTSSKTWESVGRIRPDLNKKWMLARCD
jgi:asparagine synthase (glutamine-hydrolysing)